MSRLEIPLKNSEEVVEISPDDLEDSFSQILELLCAEEAPVNVFLQFALEYDKIGLHEKCLTLLEQSLKMKHASKNNRLLILNAIGGFYIHRAIENNDKKAALDYYEKATSKYNEADTIDVQEEKSWLGKGVLLLARKEFERAVFQFQTLLDRNLFPELATLGKVRLDSEAFFC